MHAFKQTAVLAREEWPEPIQLYLSPVRTWVGAGYPLILNGHHGNQ